MAKSPADMAASMIDNLKAKTGRTLEQWFTVIRKGNLAKHGEITKHLKGEHSITHGYANLIAMKFSEAADGGPAADEDLLAAQYSGDKQALLPIYNAILSLAEKLGPDVEVAPKKTYVSLRRNKQFALIQPSTSARIDLGINLKGREPTDRLEASGKFNGMVSHRVRLTKKQQVNAELKRWLKEAYEASG